MCRNKQNRYENQHSLFLKADITKLNHKSSLLLVIQFYTETLLSLFPSMRGLDEDAGNIVHGANDVFAGQSDLIHSSDCVVDLFHQFPCHMEGISTILIGEEERLFTGYIGETPSFRAERYTLPTEKKCGRKLGKKVEPFAEISCRFVRLQHLHEH